MISGNVGFKKRSISIERCAGPRVTRLEGGARTRAHQSEAAEELRAAGLLHHPAAAWSAESGGCEARGTHPINARSEPGGSQRCCRF